MFLVLSLQPAAFTQTGKRPPCSPLGHLGTSRRRTGALMSRRQCGRRACVCRQVTVERPTVSGRLLASLASLEPLASRALSQELRCVAWRRQQPYVCHERWRPGRALHRSHARRVSPCSMTRMRRWRFTSLSWAAAVTTSTTASSIPTPTTSRRARTTRSCSSPRWPRPAARSPRRARQWECQRWHRAAVQCLPLLAHRQCSRLVQSHQG